MTAADRVAIEVQLDDLGRRIREHTYRLELALADLRAARDQHPRPAGAPLDLPQRTP